MGIPSINMAPKMFMPAKRLALLVNMYENPSDWAANGSTYYRLAPDARGNNSIYTLEAALRRGILQMQPDVEFCLKNMIGKDGDEAKRTAERACKVVADMNKTMDGDTFDGAKRLILGDPRLNELESGLACSLWAIYARNAVTFYKENTAHEVHYDHIAKIFPDQNDPKNDAFGVLSFFSSIADKDTLTFLFIRAHGTPEKIGDFEYEELLEKLDKVPGKKMIVALACYSGMVVDHVQKRDNFDDYAVITSTQLDETGTNWSDDKIFDRLTDVFIRNRQPLSNFGSDGKLFMASGMKDMQMLKLHFPFDVIL